MKPTTKLKRSGRKPSGRPRGTAFRGDIARAMFARWERDHADPQPVSWKEFQAKLENSRLRETPLFAK